METQTLDALFAPDTIAIIGASTDPDSVGSGIAKNLLTGDFPGKAYPVNPKTDTLFGVPCYRRIADVPEERIDLAIIIVPARIVPDVLLEAWETKHIRAAIVISAGFKETGEDGKKLEEALTDIAREKNIALLGPNCLGVLSPKGNLNASFASELPKEGSTAFFSQSGALCTAILDLAHGRIGFSKFASTGNKAVIGEGALLEYFAEDTETKTIAFYSENLEDANGLIGLGRKLLAKGKPVIGLKSGRTDAGTKASSSHTGALAGSESSYTALFRQARMLRAKTLRELLDSVAIFSENPIPKGNRLAIITNAGGLGVLATDQAIESGLLLADITEGAKATLREHLPAAASVLNPIDVLGDARGDRFRVALDTLIREDGVDMLLVIVTPQTMTEAFVTAQAIENAKRVSGKPVVAVFAGRHLLTKGIEFLKRSGVSVFSYPEEATLALGSLAKVALWQKQSFSPKREFTDIDRNKAREVIAKAYAEERAFLYEREAYAVLDAYGFPLLKNMYAQSPEEAERAAREIGRPVAIKIVSPDIIHKTDSGGVFLDIAPEQARETYEKLLHRVHTHVPDAKLEGATIVEMATPGGKEIILGLKKEPALGTLLLAGMGGIYTEALSDASLRFVPIGREDAEEMLHELRSIRLLSGTRGEKSIDFGKLVELMERLSLLAEDFPEIVELDINPVLAFPDADDFRVVDARIAIKV
jgi:acetyltransferase